MCLILLRKSMVTFTVRMFSSGRFQITVLAFYFLSRSFGYGFSFLNVYPKIRQIPVVGDVGEPLFLTPLLEAGKIAEAVQRARVGSLPGDQGIVSYSGYLTVNKTYNSNLFFWFFPAEVNNATAPVVLWLQGGPGGSSLFGLFTENGPFTVDDTLTLQRREYSWAANHSVLYIDNPVGSGFSFTEDERGYATNEEDVGNDLHIALTQFFTLFPDIQNNDFFLTGESYAGKYIPAIGYTIHSKNPTADVKINLKGIAIGNGLVDPINQLNYADYAYQLGLIDSNDREKLIILQNECIKQIEQKNYAAARLASLQVLQALEQASGFLYLFNYLYDQGVSVYDSFVQQRDVRLQIHVGNLTFNEGREVRHYLFNDICKSVKPWLEVLLDNYRVILYSGQLDIIVAYPLTDNFVQKLRWSGSEEFKNATRKKWRIGNHLAGYAKTAGRFTEILVRNAGHTVPTDQPLFASDLLNRLTSDISFS